MWKFVLILVVTVLAVLAAQFLLDTPLFQPGVGALVQPPTLMYGGIRG